MNIETAMAWFILSTAGLFFIAACALTIEITAKVIEWFEKRKKRRDW